MAKPRDSGSLPARMRSAAARRVGFLPLSWRYPPPSRRAEGVLFIGYAEAALGLADSFRSLVATMAGSGLPMGVFPYDVHVENRIIGPFLPELYDRDASRDVNVIEMAANELPFLFSALPRQCARPARNILRTYWELPRAPAEWASALGRIDEIWAPNEFVAAAFRPVFSGPIALVPPRVVVVRRERHGRSHFGLPEERRLFLFSFDHNSSPARKNPLGVMEAFATAFPDAAEDVGLVVKCTGAGGARNEIIGEIRSRAARDPRVIVIERTMSRDEMLSLIEVCDCYVSLHRAEGFGLGMAESLAFGRPVIGTDYSGSRDFLSPETGYPVAWTPKALTARDYVAWEGQTWAEPDIAAAADAMRRVIARPEEAAARAARGKALIETKYGPDNVRAIALERLAAYLPRR